MRLGPVPRQLAGVLLRRLRDRSPRAGRAAAHSRTGQVVSRRAAAAPALGCYWRRDGVAVWQDQSLVAEDGWDYRHGDAEAQRFAAGLAARLNVDPDYLIPGYEDAWYYLWRERRLPVNVDPLKSNLDDEQEAARLARVFEQGPGRRLRRCRCGPAAAGQPALGERPVVPAARHDVSDSGRRMGCGCRSICCRGRRRKIGCRSSRSTRCMPRGPLPLRPDGRRPSCSRRHAPRLFQPWASTQTRLKAVARAREIPCGNAARPSATCAWSLRRLPCTTLLLRFLEDATQPYAEMRCSPRRSKASTPPPHDHRLNLQGRRLDSGVLEVNVHPAHKASWSRTWTTPPRTTGLHREFRRLAWRRQPRRSAA